MISLWKHLTMVNLIMWPLTRILTWSSNVTATTLAGLIKSRARLCQWVRKLLLTHSKTFFYNSTLKLIIWDNKPFIGTFVKILKKWVDYWQALPVDFLKTILLYLIHLWFSAGDFFAYTRREPVGVCGQIIPVCLVLLLSIQEYIW